MKIVMLGIDHTRAGVDERALFSFTKKQAAEAMVWLCSQPKIRGSVILSTCNRMELWLSTEEDFSASLPELLCAVKGIDCEKYSRLFLVRQGQEAAEHLFYLAAGLRSMILAEDQIITQIKDALALSREQETVDSVLEVLFRRAVTAGKRVKTEVAFSRGNQTAMDRAVELLLHQGFPLAGSTCMVIGNGEMGRLAAQTLRAAGANVTVTVRQYRSGVVNIPQGCDRIHYGERLEFLPKCGLVVSATASPNYTLTEEALAQMDVYGKVFVDLAVPRDIEPAVGRLPGVQLYTIDDFRMDDREKESAAMTQAEAILQEELAELADWMEGVDLIPRITALRKQAVQDFELRLTKVMKNLPQEQRQELTAAVDAAADKMLTKLLFGMRDAMSDSAFRESVAGMERVYE